MDMRQHANRRRDTAQVGGAGTEADGDHGRSPQATALAGKLVRLVLADHDERFTADLVKRLEAEAEFAVLGTATSDTAALSAVARWSPDVVLLDLHLPEHGGIQAIYGLKAIAPRCAVLILAQEYDQESATAARRAGASGYLLKEIAVQD